MKKVLITGATGFLGRYTVREFAQNGWDTVAFGRNEAAGARLVGENSGVTFIRGDFTDKAQICSAAVGADVVIHAGALSSSWGSWDAFYSANVLGTDNVNAACLKAGVKKLVYVSSPSVYTAKYDRLNIKENDFDPANDLNFYIKTKIMSERRIAEAAGGKIEYNIIRPRGLVGAGDTNIIPALLRAGENHGIPLFNGGRSIVDMTSVENVAYALRLCAEASGNDGAVYNITNGEPYEFKAILDRLLTVLGRPKRYRELDFARCYRIASVAERLYRLLRIYDRSPVLTRYLVCVLSFSQTLDISRARSELGYSPKVTLEESIHEYAE